MIILDEAPKLILPDHYETKRPAIIRPGVDLAKYFPVEIDRKTRRAIVKKLAETGRLPPDEARRIVRAMAIPFGMFKGGGERVTNGTPYAAAAASHNIDMPDGSGGKLLLIVGTIETATVTTPSGWTLLFDDESTAGSTGQDRRMRAYTRDADGSEGSAVTVSTTNNNTCGIIHRITNVSSAFSYATAVGSGSGGNPPNLNMGSSAETVWLAVLVKRGSNVATAGPAGYSDVVSTSMTNMCIAAAYLVSTETSQDPGAFTQPDTSNSHYVAATIGVR